MTDWKLFHKRSTFARNTKRFSVDKNPTGCSRKVLLFEKSPGQTSIIKFIKNFHLDLFSQQLDYICRWKVPEFVIWGLWHYSIKNFISAIPFKHHCWLGREQSHQFLQCLMGATRKFQYWSLVLTLKKQSDWLHLFPGIVVGFSDSVSISARWSEVTSFNSICLTEIWGR